MEDVSMCELCQQAYEPEEINGVRKLKAFQGYTVDVRLQEFRKFAYGKESQFTEFASSKGKKLLTQMHEEVTQ